MLKKLVKYGNSNAIVLDKPILELLGMEEGSTIKITTDGKSLILTPTEKVNSSSIDQPYSLKDAVFEMRANSFAKELNLSDEEKNNLYKLMIAQKEGFERVGKSKGYMEKATEIGAKYINNPLSPEYKEELNLLIKKLDPMLYETMTELSTIEKKVENKNFISDEHKAKLYEEFSSLFKKNKQNLDDQKIQEEMNSPEYIHAIQLAAEKFKVTQNSEEFTQEMQQASKKYAPTLCSIQEQVAAVGKAYQNKKN